jgi:CBS domain containing-hemolysin-like protein
MKVGEVLVLVLTLAALSLFLLSYRRRTILWLDPAARSVQLDDEELKKRSSASGGLYLVEILALSTACYLSALCLRVLGLTGIGLWLLSSAVSLFVAVVLGPLSVRQALSLRPSLLPETIFATPTKPPFFPQTVLAAAERLRGILIGSRGRVDEAGRKVMSIESRHGREVLRLLLRLRERQISEVMVSRIDMVCAEESSTVSEVADLVREAAYTRIPVFSGTIDSIKGYVTAKDVVIRLHQGGGADAVSSIAREPVFVLSDATIEHALEEMQRARVTLAIVTDRSGKTAGLVTGEDILEEVVGDLYEDYQPEEPAYQVIDDRTAIVRANVALGDLKEILGVVPSADLGQTLGDYVRKQLGVEPSRGEQVSDDVFSYSVAKTTGNAIWSLKVEKKD